MFGRVYNSSKDEIQQKLWSEVGDEVAEASNIVEVGKGCSNI